MSRQPGRVRVIAVGFFLFIGIFLLAVLYPQRQVGADTEEPKIMADFCMDGIWRGCLVDLSNETEFVSMSRADLGEGIYEDTYEYRGTIPETGEPDEYFSRRRNYRGLFLIKITGRQRYNLPQKERQGIRPDQVGRLTVSDHNFQYDAAELAAAFSKLMAGQEVKIYPTKSTSRYEYYSCRPFGPCSEATSTGHPRIVEWINKPSNGERWVVVRKDFVETLDGPIEALLIEHLNSTRLYWYDPISEQVIQHGIATPWAEEQYDIRSRRVRIVPN